MFIVFLTALALSVSPQGNDTERIISCINAAYSSVDAVSCDYYYSKDVSLLSEPVKASGHVSVDRISGRLEWNGTEPSGSTLIFTSTDVQGTAITKENRQIYKKISKLIESLVKSQEFLPSEGFGTSACETSSGYVLTCIPESGDFGMLFSRMVLIFDSRNFLLRSIQLEDAYGDTTLITISGVKLSKK